MKRKREELNQSHERVRLVETTDNEESNASAKKRLEFEVESDTDDEVFIDTQAHKKRRMSKEVDELKAWIATQVSALSTKKQSEEIKQSINHHAAQIQENKFACERNAKDISEMKGTLSNIERELVGGARGGDGRGGQIGPISIDDYELQTPLTSTNSYARAVITTARKELTTNQRCSRVVVTDEEYDLSRRSVLLWPIDGEDSREIKKNFEDFCRTALGSDPASFGNVELARERSAPKGRAYLVISANL